MPADLTGTEVWRPQDGCSEFQPGPIFHSILLADEINRAPAKVQSALLEAMGERQVTAGRQTYALPALFLVMATQNPIEQGGHVLLPEAQLDRFLMHVRIGYPQADAETAIPGLERAWRAMRWRARPRRRCAHVQAEVIMARGAVLDVHVAPALERYIVELVLASREPARYDAALARRIALGVPVRVARSRWSVVQRARVAGRLRLRHA